MWYAGFRLPQLTKRLWVQDWGTFAPPADIAQTNLQPLQPYVFRPGGYWQPSKITIFPAPFDPSIGDRPIQQQYAFRPGRYWQPSKIWIATAPLDAPANPTDRTPLRGYAFRRGGLWQPSKIWIDTFPVDAVVVVIPTPPVVVIRSGGGGSARRRRRKKNLALRRALYALQLQGLLTFDEIDAILAKVEPWISNSGH